MHHPCVFPCNADEHMQMVYMLFAQTALEGFLFPEASSLAAELDRSTSPGFRRLNAAVAQLVDEWSMVSFAALDYSDEESIGDVLAQIDHCIQVWASMHSLVSAAAWPSGAR